MLASGRRNQNSIWSLVDEDGNSYEDEAGLKELVQSHFANIFRDDGGTCLMNQLKVVMLYPKMISDENESDLSCPVTLGEIEFALKYF